MDQDQSANGGAVELLGEGVDRDVFRRNLDRLMTMAGMRNATLAREMGVSRHVVGLWRSGVVLPKLSHFRQLLFIFDCDVDAFIGDHPTRPMLSLKLWAAREQISLARARTLFELGCLPGAWEVGEQVFVPPTLPLPANSHQLMAKTKRQPAWGRALIARLNMAIDKPNITRGLIAHEVGVTWSAVDKWCSGASYPTADKLTKIAAVLGVTEDVLLTPPSMAGGTIGQIDQH